SAMRPRHVRAIRQSRPDEGPIQGRHLCAGTIEDASSAILVILVKATAGLVQQEGAPRDPQRPLPVGQRHARAGGAVRWAGSNAFCDFAQLLVFDTSALPCSPSRPRAVAFELVAGRGGDVAIAGKGHRACWGSRNLQIGLASAPPKKT